MSTVSTYSVEVDSITYIEQEERPAPSDGFADEDFGNPNWEAESDAMTLAEMEYLADKEAVERQAERERLAAQPHRLSTIDAWNLWLDGKLAREVYEYCKEREQAEWVGWNLYRLESGGLVMHMAGTSPEMVYRVARQTGWIGCGGAVRVYEVPVKPAATYEAPTAA